MAEHWQIFAALVALIAAWSLIILGTTKYIISKCVGNVEQKITGLSAIGQDYQRLERALLELKADLPLSYVRKEDFVRFDVVINTKLDRLRDLIEALQQNREKN
jgi:hypothetical protein